MNRADQIYVTVTFIVFAVVNAVGWSVRLATGDEGGRAMASTVFAVGLVILLGFAAVRLAKRKV